MSLHRGAPSGRRGLATGHARAFALGAGPLGVTLVLLEAQWPRAGAVVALATLGALALAVARREPAVWWAAEARRTRVLVVLAACGLVGGAFWGPIAGRGPRWEARRAFDEKRDDDPWGRPWCIRPGVVYSMGPDGVDEAGRGDDVDVVDTGDRAILSATDRLFVQQLAIVLIATLVPLIDAFAAIGEELILGARSESLGREAARAFAIASGPTLVLAPFAFIGFEMAGKHQNALDATLVPAPLAAAGTVAFVCFLAAFAWRIARPLNPPA